MLISRPAYLGKLIAKMNNGMIKVITGIRRSGKSFLLFNLFYSYLLEHGTSPDQIIAINLEDYACRDLRSPDKLYEYVSARLAPHRQYYVLLDEAQYAIRREDLKNPDIPLPLYDVLNGLLRRQDIDIYVTGSNSKFLSTDVMTEFRGRGDQIQVQPLAFSEFCSAYAGTVHDAWNEYMYYGGLPHILAEPDAESKSRYLKHLFSEIYFKDIKERYGIKNDSGMEEIVRIVASSIGSLTNPNRIARTFESSGKKSLSPSVIAGYLRCLQDSFILQKAERYDVKGRKYISTPSKYYFTDVGLRNAHLNFRQVEPTHLMENILYNELAYRGFNVDVGIVEINGVENGKHVKRQLEVDFVAGKGSSRYYIQSAYALDTREKTEQEQRSLNSIPDSFKKIIVTQGDFLPWHTEQGTLVIGAEKFLLDPGSMDL